MVPQFNKKFFTFAVNCQQFAWPANVVTMADMFALASLLASGAPIVAEALLYTPAPGLRGRTPVVQDEVASRIAAEGFEGLEKAFEWRPGSVGEDGWVSGVPGRAWRLVRIESPVEQAAMLEIAGVSDLWVNGAPRAGNVYGASMGKLPISLQAGTNWVLSRGARGRLRFALSGAPAAPFVQPEDAMLSDFTFRDAAWRSGPIGLVVVNPTAQPLRGQLDCGGGDWPVQVEPFASAKMPCQPPSFNKPPMRGGFDFEAKLKDSLGRVVHSLPLRQRTAAFNEVHRRTFISDIDGSAQYFAVNPSPNPKPGQALILSLHGASVEADGQARAYGQKDWANLAAATNRRPFGFDWEDWGTTDALEVLRHARDLYQPDPRRLLLTGHSMGGHGTWMVGATQPTLFAAIGPAAGWRSFWSYGGAFEPNVEDPIGAVLAGANLQSRPDLLLKNHGAHGVFILHGDADTTVPIAEAQAMKEALEPWHPRVGHFWEPGGGHWYDTSPAPGADAVDDARMMNFLKDSVRPERVLKVDFATYDLSLSSKADWVTVLQKRSESRTARIQAELSESGLLTATTENIAALRLNTPALKALGWSGRVMIDGIQAKPDAAGNLTYESDNWAGVPASGRMPWMRGPFKRAFHRFVLVYGTQGSAQENEATRRQAVRDAELWWQRGNGTARILSDQEWLRRGAEGQPIIYGGQHVNRLWQSQLAGSQVLVDRGSVRLGGSVLRRPTLGVLAVLPMSGGGMAGVVASTGEPGARTLEMMSYLSSGVNVPDVLVVDSEMLSKGLEGIAAAGWFENNWRVGSQVAKRGEWTAR
jgi:predicted esterase